MEEATFGKQLKSWRTAAGVKQSEVERVLGNKSRGYCTHLEKGAIRPPGRADCHKLAALLEVAPDAVWQAAALDLMARAIKDEPGLSDYFSERLKDARGFELSQEEQCLLEALRASLDPDSYAVGPSTIAYAPGQDGNPEAALVGGGEPYRPRDLTHKLTKLLRDAPSMMALEDAPTVLRRSYLSDPGGPLPPCTPVGEVLHDLLDRLTRTEPGPERWRLIGQLAEFVDSHAPERRRGSA